MQFLEWKCVNYRLKINWSLLSMVQLTTFRLWFRQWLGAGQATSHYLNQWWLFYWRLIASLTLNDLSDSARDPGRTHSELALVLLWCSYEDAVIPGLPACSCSCWHVWQLQALSQQLKWCRFNSVFHPIIAGICFINSTLYLWMRVFSECAQHSHFSVG